MEKEQKQCGLQLPLHQDVSLPVDWPPESPDNQYHLNK